jgi:nicotinamide-nucleotide amidase
VKTDEITALARELGEALAAAGLVASVAESCTGGGVAEAITRIPGSSAWFDRGFVTYSNDAKMEVLDVQQGTLDAHGAVSEETAQAMLRGALARSDAHLATAVTGIAGPDGGSPEKPVGLVWFAWGLRDAKPITESRRFGGDRDGVRAQAVAYALRGLLELVRRPG